MIMFTGPALEAFPKKNTALPMLFALYVTGTIAEPVWNQLMRVFDACAVTPKEREVLAEFFTQTFRELGPDGMTIPRLTEVQALLAEMRAQA
jgi:hypothetical protein